jgi:hypothetical protein
VCTLTMHGIALHAIAVLRTAVLGGTPRHAPAGGPANATNDAPRAPLTFEGRGRRNGP